MAKAVEDTDVTETASDKSQPSKIFSAEVLTVPPEPVPP